MILDFSTSVVYHDCITEDRVWGRGAFFGLTSFPFSSFLIGVVLYKHSQDNAVKTTCKSLSDGEDSTLWTLKNHIILAFGTGLFWKPFLKMGHILFYKLLLFLFNSTNKTEGERACPSLQHCLELYNIGMNINIHIKNKLGHICTVG